MKKNLKNKILLICSLVGLFVGVDTSYANNIVLQYDEPLLINGANSNTEDSRVLPNTTIQGDGSLDKAEDYVERKLFDIVGFFQSLIKPLTYVTFIISAIAILFGVITNSKKGLAVGILGMVVSIGVYVAVVFAPQIVEYFGAWLAM